MGGGGEFPSQFLSQGNRPPSPRTELARNRILRGGTPRAVTQEDFLVFIVLILLHNFDHCLMSHFKV